MSNWDNENLAPFIEIRKALMAIGDKALENLDQEDEQLWFDTLVLLHSVKSDIASIFTQYSNLIATKLVVPKN